MDTSGLAQLLDLLRSKGVRLYRAKETAPNGANVATVEVEFLPQTDADSVTMPTQDESSCLCGHGAHEHSSDGLCLHGCDVETCAPKETRT